MIQVILTPDQQKQIENAKETVEIVDRSGHVFARLELGFSASEISEADRRSKNFQSGGEFHDLIQRVDATGTKK